MSLLLSSMVFINSHLFWSTALFPLLWQGLVTTEGTPTSLSLPCCEVVPIHVHMFLVPKLYLYMYRWGSCLRSLCTPHHVCPTLLLSWEGYCYGLHWVTNCLGHLKFWCKIKTTREFISSCRKWSLRLFLICAGQKCLVIPFPSERLNLDVHRLLN